MPRLDIGKAPSYKSTANSEQLAIASLFPRPTSSVMHTRVDCATSFAPRDLRDRASKSPSSSDEYLKILMMVRWVIASILAWFSPYFYRARNLIERFFNRIKQCRRIATRYDKLAANYLAFVKLALIRI